MTACGPIPFCTADKEVQSRLVSEHDEALTKASIADIQKSLS